MEHKTPVVEHDEDDPPHTPTWQDHYWWFANRWAEAAMHHLRFLGLI